MLAQLLGPRRCLEQQGGYCLFTKLTHRAHLSLSVDETDFRPNMRRTPPDRASLHGESVLCNHNKRGETQQPQECCRPFICCVDPKQPHFIASPQEQRSSCIRSFRDKLPALFRPCGHCFHWVGSQVRIVCLAGCEVHKYTILM